MVAQVGLLAIDYLFNFEHGSLKVGHGLLRPQVRSPKTSPLWCLTLILSTYWCLMAWDEIWVVDSPNRLPHTLRCWWTSTPLFGPECNDYMLVNFYQLMLWIRICKNLANFKWNCKIKSVHSNPLEQTIQVGSTNGKGLEHLQYSSYK